jgi:hypothetical protein
LTKDEARAQVHRAEDKYSHTVGSESTLAEHPKALVAGSFGLGFLAGFITGGGDDDSEPTGRPRDRHVREFEQREQQRSFSNGSSRGRERDREDEGPSFAQKSGGMAGGLAAKAYGPLGSVIQDVVMEVQDDVANFVREFIQTGKDRLMGKSSEESGSRRTWSVDHGDTRMPSEEERPTAEELLPRGRGDESRSDAPRARQASKN